MDISELEKDIENLVSQKCNCEQIHSVLCAYDINGDVDNVVIFAIDNFLLSSDQLKYIICNLKTLSSYMELLKKIIVYEGKLQTQLFIQKILQIYDVILSEDEINYLIKHAEDCEYSFGINLEDVKVYLNYYITSKTYAPKPSWVTRKEGENISLLETVDSGAPLGEIYQSTKIRNMMKENSSLIKSLSINNKNIENIEESLISFLSTLSKTKDAKEVDQPSRLFGPPNAFEKRDCSTGPNGAGPCRMLECGCLTDYEDDQTDWFTGNCDQCNNIILNRSHAVRFPKEKGGWEGCFCCIDCIRDKYNIDEDNDVENLDHSMFRLQLLKNSLEKNGIMDRH